MAGTAGEETVESEERRIKRVMTDACNNSMRRAGKIKNRKAVYWWNDEIAEIRGRCGAWRRRLIRAKKRKYLEHVTEIVNRLKETGKELRIPIGKAKREAWEDLLYSLDRDPWEHPYKMVLNKIKQDNIGICEKMETEAINRILEELFPKTNTINMGGEETIREKDLIREVSVDEIESISKRAIKKGMRAPGPDGIPARLVAEAQRC